MLIVTVISLHFQSALTLAFSQKLCTRELSNIAYYSVTLIRGHRGVREVKLQAVVYQQIVSDMEKQPKLILTIFTFYDFTVIYNKHDPVDPFVKSGFVQHPANTCNI